MTLRAHVLILSCFLFTGCVASGTTKESKVDPKKAMSTRLELGKKYLDSGNRDQALRQFLDVLEHDKSNPQALQGLGLVHQLNGEPIEAESAFKKSIKYADEKEIASSRYTYGVFLKRTERCPEALKQFEAVAKDISFPQRASALYFVGVCSLEQNSLVRAKGAFKHALNLRPKMSAPMLELAEMAFKEQDYAESKNYLDRFNVSGEASARSLWLGIRIERIFGNRDKESSQAMALKNLFGYSREYLEYQQFIESNH
jgi:type IV pilus assembly protein PilF